jgi:hypothetical protein
MTHERIAMMEKARAKRQRRAQKKAARLAAPLDSGAGFAGKVVDLAEGAVAHVGCLVKVAAARLSLAE